MPPDRPVFTSARAFTAVSRSMAPPAVTERRLPWIGAGSLTLPPEVIETLPVALIGASTGSESERARLLDGDSGTAPLLGDAQVRDGRVDVDRGSGGHVEGAGREHAAAVDATAGVERHVAGSYADVADECDRAADIQVERA